MNFFADMARTAHWDILRINRLQYVDVDSEDDLQLNFVAKQVAEAKQMGYRRIFLGGHLRGAWLALSGARIEGVEGVIGLTPATRGYSVEDLEWTRNELARRLESAKARRIAVFFFENDPNELVPGGRVDATRNALERSGAHFMVVDRPAGVEGNTAPWRGRFIRRYRDCVLKFMRQENPDGGDATCATDWGYAIGADIGFPLATAFATDAPSHRRFSAYDGRWQGDSDEGAYVVMEPIRESDDAVVVRLGMSPPPGQPRLRPLLRELSLRPNETGRVLSGRLPGTTTQVVVRLNSADGIDLELQEKAREPAQVFQLHR
ncbi:MAG: hypothetical protein JSR47_20920 [Proteobacteria bacterium]|nr:hypothetical protein [Pseudomonadota bacterium]